MSVSNARYRLGQLSNTLRAQVERDPDQEVTDLAVIVLDNVFQQIKPLLSDDDPVVAALGDLLTPTAAVDGSIRALSLLIIVDQMLAGLPRTPNARSWTAAGHQLPIGL